MQEGALQTSSTKLKNLLALVWVMLWFLGGCEPQIEKEAPSPEPTPLALDAPFYFGDFIIPPNNPTTVEGVDLGRMLFYDPRLSVNNSVSCATCHQQEKAFTDGLRNGVGVFGRSVPFKTMSLVNVAWERHMFWNGRKSSLESQAIDPIVNPNEMGMNINELIGKLQSIPEYRTKFNAAFGSEQVNADRIEKALAQFQRTLISANSKYDKYLRGEVQLSAIEKTGMDLFFTHPEPAISLRGGNCGDCHLPITTGGSKDGFRGFHNNGLDDDASLRPGLQQVSGRIQDRGKFKAPNLRNIMVRAPYMHDGRFNSIEEVLDHYNEHIKLSGTLDVLILEASNEPIVAGQAIKLHLTASEKAAIIAFLHTLTDHDFLTNPKFSDPFKP